jgi:uncharacterized protein (TIGR03437 family)
MRAFTVILLLGLLSGRMWSQIGNIAVTDAASFQVGIPAKGSIASIFCTGVSISGTLQAEGTPLPWSLDGVSVTIGGANAPLFSVSGLSGYQQINVQVPQEIVFASDGSAAITVSQDGETGTGTGILQGYYPTLATPGEFFTSPNPLYGAFQHATDYSPVTAENPAHAGETVIGYLTGLAGTVPVVPTGQASPYSPLAVVPQTTVQMSPRVREYSIVTYTPVSPAITFLGLAPGLVGVYQVNFILPSSPPAGDLKIQLQFHHCEDACFFGGQGWMYSKPVLLPVG